MIFLNEDFLSDKDTIQVNFNGNSITSLQLNGGEYDHMYITKDTDITYDILNEPDSDKRWKQETVFDGTFDNTLDGGNLNYNEQEANFLVIRRRPVGEKKWTVVLTKDIENNLDLKISFEDKYCRNNITYEYAISLYSGTKESSRYITSVTSTFNGYYVMDKDCIFGTVFNVDGCDTQRQMSVDTLEVINEKYLHSISHSELNCDTGSVSGDFIDLDCDTLDINDENGLEIRKSLLDRLANKKPFILKIDDGRIWLVKATGNPTDSMNENKHIRTIGFDWAEVGDYNNPKDLYYSDLSDVNEEWW